MYYPYFRGKQYELITIRENAQLLKDSRFVPIIEPVKESTNGLKRTVDALLHIGGECILIVNPNCGDYSADGSAIHQLIESHYTIADKLSVGILLNAGMSINDVRSIYEAYPLNYVTFIHYGFEEGRDLASAIADMGNVTRHIFIEDYCGKLYRKNFKTRDIPRILVRDGFQKRINREHPKVEPFSDLHATFADEEGMQGFGDFLIVGDDYSESGGPAYAVAIHLTYIDDTKDGAMYIHHFVSDRTDTPTDPAGKFAEALAKLVGEVNKAGSPIMKSIAVHEYLSLHEEHHYPGLGYVKKLSMQHHIETLANYCMW
ncbi:MAG: sce7725 family protein [Armatimonadota bacterium]